MGRDHPKERRAGRSVGLKRAGLVVASTVLSLVLAEGALGALHVGEPLLRDVDPILGWAPIPGAEGWWTREGRALVQISEHGFRGVTVPPEKPDGTFRLVILGDSYTEAKQVAAEDAFPRHVERALGECLARPVEVVSFGVAGYGTAQERLVLEHHGWRWQPDAVLVAFLTGNDVSDNHPALRTSGDPAPYYRLVDGELELDDSFAESEWYRERASGGLGRELRRRSRLARLIGSLGRAHRERERGELGLSDAVYSEPATAEWREAWAWTEAILMQMHEDARDHHARFGVVTLTNAIQIDPDPTARARHARSIGVEDLEYPDRRVAALGERVGFEVLRLVPPMRAWAEGHHRHLHGFPNTAPGTGHWNEEGHRVAGAEIGRWLCRALADGPASARGAAPR